MLRSRLILPLLVLLLASSASLAAEPLDQNGVAHAWKGELGSYTVVDFAAIWCAPCRKTLPELQKLAERYPAVRFLVVSVDEEEAGRDRLVEELDLHLPVLWDESHEIAEHYQPEVMPSTLLLDAEGQTVLRVNGSQKSAWRRLEETLADLPEPGR